MAGQLPPMHVPSPPSPAREGLLTRLWSAFFPGAEIPSQPTGNESFWFRAIFRPWPLPLRVATFVAMTLIAIVAFCLWELSTNSDHVPWRYSLTPLRIAAVSLLLLVIPLTVYQALKMWLNVEKSPFPDINSAWHAGIDALRKQGLTVGDKPLFLVIGSTGEAQDRAMFESANLASIVAGVPEGPAPLRWYVNADRIVLSCVGASWLSALSSLIELSEKRRSLMEGNSSPFPESFDGGGTPTVLPSIANPRSSSAAGNAPKAAPPPPGAPFKTISFASVAHEFPEFMADDKDGLASAMAAIDSPLQQQSLAIIQPSDAAEQRDRLEAVCQLLRNVRHPYCPINGCIGLIPFASAGIELQVVEEIAKAVNSDLQTLYKTLQVRYPVTAIFTGLESEPGFRELMRRVGPEQCANGRFGMSYDLRSPASAGEIGTFAPHVCGVFEEWVYGLFRQDQALKRPGNASLFSLLCRIRSSFKDRLQMLLAQGFGYSERLLPDEVPFLFSGCYFVASGTSSDKRGFIEGIAEKLKGQQDQLEWSPEAIRSTRRVRLLSMLAFAMIGVLALWLVYMIFNDPRP